MLAIDSFFSNLVLFFQLFNNTGGVMELLEHPIMRLGAKAMSCMVCFLYVALGAVLAVIYLPSAHAKGQKKEIKRVAAPITDPLPFDPARAHMECLKKRDVKKCDMMVELLQNFEDIKKKNLSR